MRPSLYFDGPIGNINWRVLKLLWPYLLEFKGRVALALLCLIIAKIASVGLPFVLKSLVDTLSNSFTEQLVAVPIALVIAYGSLRLLNTIISEVRDTLFGRVTERSIRRLGLSVFEHLHRLELAFHLERRTGGLSRDIERGTTGINFLMRFMVFNIVPTFIEIALVVGILFYNYGIAFAVITSVAVGAYILFSIMATEWRTSFVRDAAKADSQSNTRAVDSLLNYETVKYFNNEHYEAEKYDQSLAQWETAKRKNRLSLFALNTGQALIISLAMTLMLALAATQVKEGKMTIGDFVLINAFMMQLFIPLNFLGFVYREIRGALANIEQMFNLLARAPAIEDAQQAISPTLTLGKIRFENVSFYYNDRLILDDISFELEPGQKIAIVGDSGAGKSTIVKLLFRFYEPQKGRIFIDDHDILTLTQHALRQAIAIVPQDTVLFNDSLLENIRYGAPAASDERVQQAINLAHLSFFIKQLSAGWHTKVGERGLKLSGGEKQRVAIARAILKGSPLLVFDEATSSLDSHAEQAILQAIKAMVQGHSSLVIAHRLSTIVDADQILVLNQGKIVERGNHHHLLKEKGLYHSLWTVQNQQALKTEPLIEPTAPSH